MLGIGGGTVKVPIMVLLLGLPTKSAIATSAFMIGVTTSTAAFIYFMKGYVNSLTVAYVVTGILIGAQVGSRIALKLKAKTLRYSFGFILFIFALRMLLNGFGL